MSRLAFVAVVVASLVSAVPAAAAGVRAALDEGFALFDAQRFEEAAAKFAAAAAGAAAEGLDPAVAGYDRAIALLRAGKPVEAAAAFADVGASADSGLRESAHYHRGIALATAAAAAESKGAVREAVSLLEEALGAYESAMRIDPQDEDPKVNHELASRKLSQLTVRQPDSPGASPPPEPEKRERERREQPPRQQPSEREMRPDAARTLLDAMRQQELSQRSRTRPFRGMAAPVEKDW